MTSDARPFRTHAWPAYALLAAGIAVSTMFCVWSMHSIGLTAREADLFATHGGPEAAPLVRIVLFCCGLEGSASVAWRWLFHAFNVWNLLLLAAIARRAGMPRVAAWTCVLALPCARWLMGSACMDPATVAIWGVLVIQWAFGRVWREATVARAFLYAGALVAGLCATPFAIPVVAAHAVWFAVSSVAALRKHEERSAPVAMVQAFVCCLLAIAGVAALSPGVLFSPPDMAEPWRWVQDAWRAGVNAAGLFTGPWGDSFRSAGIWRLASIGAGLAALAALPALRDALGPAYPEASAALRLRRAARLLEAGEYVPARKALASRGIR